MVKEKEGRGVMALSGKKRLLIAHVLLHMHVVWFCGEWWAFRSLIGWLIINYPKLFIFSQKKKLNSKKNY